MDQHRLSILFDKYKQGILTPSEEAELNDWFHSLNLGGTDLEDYIGRLGGVENYREQRFKNFREQIGEAKVMPMKPRRKVARWYAAASIIVILSAGGYYLLRKHPHIDQIAQNQIHDIIPGVNKATLTLSDGRKIVLSDAHNGTIASQEKTLIKKTADGKLVYAESAPSLSGKGALAAVYNTLTTKRGEQYQLTLPDGSKVFLNAASSLRYPVSFTGNNRTVELTGEGYFEVVHNPAQPFRVKVNGELIEDVGTHFNINAYEDEPVLETTLLEGAVRVTGNGQKVMLKPGQASVGSANGNIGVIKADPEEAVSWKDGYFRFNGDNLASIMRKVARWYDADIVFEDPKLQGQVFSGTLTVSRFKNVSQLLNKLELTGAMHFRIENNKIIISD